MATLVRVPLPLPPGGGAAAAATALEVDAALLVSLEAEFRQLKAKGVRIACEAQ